MSKHFILANTLWTAGIGFALSAVPEYIHKLLRPDDAPRLPATEITLYGIRSAGLANLAIAAHSYLSWLGDSKPQVKQSLVILSGLQLLTGLLNATYANTSPYGGSGRTFLFLSLFNIAQAIWGAYNYYTYDKEESK
eukprot:TRINITY_DN1155_c0_g1_i1.p1 TRINITY_DN1155_c0_g1~~TRINITY_DN1155_c0_g1_i1.p1  ORF type:complete len:137 (-),score=20.84 TRINITY_DN1155_c0_g1_i1:10-420(-)